MKARFRSAVAFTLCFTVPAMIVTVTSPREAVAQPKKKPIKEQLPEAARASWDDGVELAKRGKWELARVKFQEAYDKSQNPRVLYNIAVMEKNQTHYAAAIDAWQKELDTGKGQLDASEEAEIKEAIAGLQKWIMAITIDVTEAGAEVFVDSEKVGTTPLPKPVNVSVGSHNIRVSKPGFSDANAHVDGKESAPKIQMKLDPLIKYAPLHVSVIGPANATIKVDTREVAVGKMTFDGKVTINETHSITAEAPGYAPVTQTVSPTEVDPINLTLALSTDQTKGKLLVVAKPEGAAIEIDGKTVGASRWEGPVDAGNHQVVVKKQGYYAWSYDVDVPKGGERSVTAQLNEDRNTSFVPWLIGTVLVVGGSAVAMYLIAKPKDEEPVNGTLAPFKVGTQGVRF